MARVQINKKRIGQTASSAAFFPSGSTLLDLANDGGWGVGTVTNIVGDKSSGKTLLGIEACANFARLYDVADIRYAEAESAFNIDYARSIGLPRAVIPSEVGEIRTIEDFAKDFEAFLKERDGKRPCLYILDSLDALSDDTEAESEIGTATYGTKKARMMSELFRRFMALSSEKLCSLIIISQIRDKIGVTFGETKTRSGGRALDFYASQIVWLAEVKKISRVVSSVPRVTGVQVLARNKKNKLGLPFREAEFTMLFNYGIDDERSMLDWLKKHKALPESLDEYNRKIDQARQAQDRQAVDAMRQTLANACRAKWEDIEAALAPPMSKY